MCATENLFNVSFLIEQCAFDKPDLRSRLGVDKGSNAGGLGQWCGWEAPVM